MTTVIWYAIFKRSFCKYFQLQKIHFPWITVLLCAKNAFVTETSLISVNSEQRDFTHDAILTSSLQQFSWNMPCTDFFTMFCTTSEAGVLSVGSFKSVKNNRPSQLLQKYPYLRGSSTLWRPFLKEAMKYPTKKWTQ